MSVFPSRTFLSTSIQVHIDLLVFMLIFLISLWPSAISLGDLLINQLFFITAGWLWDAFGYGLRKVELYNEDELVFLIPDTQSAVFWEKKYFTVCYCCMCICCYSASFLIQVICRSLALSHSPRSAERKGGNHFFSYVVLIFCGYFLRLGICRISSICFLSLSTILKTLYKIL